MDYGDIRYDFSAVNDAGTGVQAEAVRIAQELQEFEEMFERFIEKSFGGGAQGSTAFVILQTKWSAESVELNTKLQSIGAKVVSGGEHMQGVDAQLAKMLS